MDLIAEQTSNRGTNKTKIIQKSLSHSKLPFPETSLIPEMFQSIIPNWSSLSWLTVRSPGGQRSWCGSMSSRTRLVLNLKDGPLDELKALNCFWRSKSQFPVSGRVDPFGLWALQFKGKSIVLLTASLPLFFLGGYLFRNTVFVFSPLQTRQSAFSSG